MLQNLSSAKVLIGALMKATYHGPVPHRESYIIAHVLLNLLNELGNDDKKPVLSNI